MTRNSNTIFYNDLGGFSFYKDGEDIFIRGADSVSKKLGDILPDSIEFTITASTSPTSNYAIYGVATINIPTFGYKYMKNSDNPTEVTDISDKNIISISQSSRYAGLAASITITFYN